MKTKSKLTAKQAESRKKIKERAMWIFKNWLADDYEKNVDKILDSGLVDLDNIEDNFKDAYPIFAAIAQKAVNQALNGSSYEETRRRQKRMAKKYQWAVYY